MDQLRDDEKERELKDVVGKGHPSLLHFVGHIHLLFDKFKF